MARILLLNKPFRVMSQFRPSGDKRTLAEFVDDKDLRVAGRLDYDSEGLLVLSDDGRLVQQITHPRYKAPKTYWAQVEGEPDSAALTTLQSGVDLKDGRTLPAGACIIDEPTCLWPRDPPIRVRENIPTTWLEITLLEGRNRQVRRMTAAVGHPTLRLVRISVGDWKLGELQPGASRLCRQ
ncbi:MAG: pseudouridine synthase [Gammaproteobacteria bacterium]|nr:pseudouridine synthase [Gammaproteobacteria bacterium]NND55389.1 pseudouridine synthase [Gammaproteobacteria bacterium]